MESLEKFRGARRERAGLGAASREVSPPGTSRTPHKGPRSARLFKQTHSRRDKSPGIPSRETEPSGRSAPAWGIWDFPGVSAGSGSFFHAPGYSW